MDKHFWDYVDVKALKGFDKDLHLKVVMKKGSKGTSKYLGPRTHHIPPVYDLRHDPVDRSIRNLVDKYTAGVYEIRWYDVGDAPRAFHKIGTPGMYFKFKGIYFAGAQWPTGFDAHLTRLFGKDIHFIRCHAPDTFKVPVYIVNPKQKVLAKALLDILTFQGSINGWQFTTGFLRLVSEFIGADKNISKNIDLRAEFLGEVIKMHLSVDGIQLEFAGRPDGQLRKSSKSFAFHGGHSPRSYGPRLTFHASYAKYGARGISARVAHMPRYVESSTGKDLVTG